MGSAASRTAQRGAAPARKFPSRAPGGAIPPRAQQQQQRPPPPSQPHVSPSSAAPSPAGGSTGARPRGGSAQASYSNHEAIRADGADPDLDLNQSAAFSSRLRQMGVAQPNPTYSPSSTAGASAHQYNQQQQQQQQAASSPTFPAAAGSNTTLTVLEARRRLQERADDEFRGLGQGQGREFLDVGVIRDALVLRSKGHSDAAIEERLGIKKGLLGRLGPRGRVEVL